MHLSKDINEDQSFDFPEGFQGKNIELLRNIIAISRIALFLKPSGKGIAASRRTTTSIILDKISAGIPLPVAKQA